MNAWSQAWMPNGLAQCMTHKFSVSLCCVSALRKASYIWNSTKHFKVFFLIDKAKLIQFSPFLFSLTGLFDGLLVGDRGYACQRFLLTPYPDPQTRPQNRFNVALSKTRVKIEMTFGILKARFNCLRRLRVSPERASQIVAACAILHNIATIRKERVPPLNQLLPDEIDPITLDHPAGAAVRDAITIQYFT